MPFPKQGKRKMNSCDIELLRESILYDPLTGICTWKNRPRCHFKDLRAWSVVNSALAAKPVGTAYTVKATGKTYIRFEFFGKSLSLHRVIWALVTGEWPNKIDHQDGNGINNKWINLRDTDDIGNARNARRYKSRALPCGIYMRNTKFRAMIGVGNKLIHLGTFLTLDDALACRKEAEKTHNFHPNHGMIRPA